MAKKGKTLVKIIKYILPELNEDTFKKLDKAIINEKKRRAGKAPGFKINQSTESI